MEELEPAAAESSEQASLTSATLYCPDCGAPMDPDDRFCGACRWDAQAPERPPRRPPASPRDLGEPSNKNRLTALLLCLFAGVLGLHRFYAGRPGSGVVWLLTFGLLTVGWVYDSVMIATGEFVDDEGKRILYWE